MQGWPGAGWSGDEAEEGAGRAPAGARAGAAGAGEVLQKAASAGEELLVAASAGGGQRVAASAGAWPDAG